MHGPEARPFLLGFLVPALFALPLRGQRAPQPHSTPARQLLPQAGFAGRPGAAADDARAHLGAGLRLFDLQRYSEAAREFELALALDPKLAEARYYLAVSDFNERRYQDAREQFALLQGSDYRHAWVRYYLGRLDLIEGNTDAAIRELTGLAPEAPLQDELYYLGQAYLKKGQWPEAIRALERQVKFNPRDFRAHNFLARAYQKAGKTAEAEREFQKSEQLHEYYTRGQQDIADCRALLQTGKAEEAWARCGGIVAMEDIDKQVAAGLLFGEFAQYEHARQLFERALELDPESPEVSYDLGYTCFQQKDYATSRRYAEKALRLRPDFFEALAVDGTALYLLHEDAAARKVLERAHRLRPEDATISRLLEKLQAPSAR